MLRGCREWIAGTLLVISLAAAPIFAPTPARACGNAVFEAISKQDAIALIKQVEELLASGEYDQAYSEIKAVAGEEEHEGEIAVKGKNEKLESRLYQLYLMSLIHIGEESRAQELLTKLIADKPSDPFLQVRAAELLSLNPSKRGEARKQLERLAKKDLIVDATGYATLARLRGYAKDSAGQKEALERCQQMAKVAALCEMAPVPEAVKSVVSSWARQAASDNLSSTPPVYAADFKAVLHDGDKPVRTLDLAAFTSEPLRRPRASQTPILADSKYARAAEQPKRGEVWEATGMLRFESTSRRVRKSGVMMQIQKLIRVRYVDDKALIFYEEQFGPPSSYTPPPPAQPAGAAPAAK